MTDYTSTTPQFDSNILTLQNLNSEFNVVMKQYEQTKKNYIANLKKRSTQDDSKKYTPEYTVEKGLGFYEGSDSTHVLNTFDNTDLDACQTKCSEDPSCLGGSVYTDATTNKPTCYTAGGVKIKSYTDPNNPELQKYTSFIKTKTPTKSVSLERD